jgi:hypothetical protein
MIDPDPYYNPNFSIDSVDFIPVTRLPDGTVV